MRICLAASGGGHVRQLLDLEPAWSDFDHFFISEDTALARTISQTHRTAFVAHFALGQAKLGAPLRMLVAAARNFIQSARAILKERPTVVLTTGAGAVFFAVAWARLLGAKIILVESFARFDRPSMFFRLATPLAHHKIVQSAALLEHCPGARLFDPLRLLGSKRSNKEPLLFATVGATLPFPRLVDMVAALTSAGEISETVLVQVGEGGASPAGLDAVETLPFDEVNAILRRADFVVCHGGTGSLITALREGCRVIAVPRRFEWGEHYDNHQAEITQAFAARGLVEVADTPEELLQAMHRLRARPPAMATTEPEGLIQHLSELFAREGVDDRQETSPP
jgi:UDP-N-acetylglucosamine--N-acetylmuramyl-(pentapeptide) pyrophosphoryl-undecaprenol N-acetylglucosamine transferase